MSRRLLPYEHQLIEALGISAQEYLEFAQAQFDHTRTRDDKLLSPQNEAGTIGLVLTIVGILFQVGAALLTPRAQTPSQANVRNRRDAVFAPRYGFNSAQDLAKYGDPINLVYCNTDQNSTGGVRIATSLVWSAVQSFGSSQFMQMMAVVGASNISPNGIAFDRTAFGQLPIRQFGPRYWLYMRQNGILRFSDLRNFVNNGSDPSATGEPSSAYVYRSNLVGTSREDGFSQAFSPSSVTKCGIYAPIPINVKYIDRDEEGSSEQAELGIELEDRGSYWPDDRFDDSRPVVPVGHRFTLRFKSLSSSNASDVRQAASELRRTLLSTIDVASTYKLGSLHLRPVGPLTDLELDNDATNITFECIRSGVCPEEDYATTNFKQNEAEARKEIIRLEQEVAVLNDQLLKNEPILKPGIGSDVTDRLEEIKVRKNLIGDFEDRKWTSEELDYLLDNADGTNNQNIFDPIVVKFAQRLDDQRELRKSYQDRIDDELDKASADRNRQKIRDWRDQIRALNKQIKKTQAKLDKAFQQYGLADGVIPGRDGRTLKQEKIRLNQLERRLNEEIANLVSDANNLDLVKMAERDTELRKQITDKNTKIAEQQAIIDNPELQNDFFNTKCLTKIEEAAYETITPCRIVDFALKARVFKRVAGRQRTYGKVEMKKYRESDNGTKLRSMFFWLWYRRSGAEWSRVPRIFVIRRGNDVDNFISLKFIADDNTGNWQFKFEPIAETAAEMRYHGLSDFAYIENAGPDQRISGPAGGTFTFKGKLRSRDGFVAPINRNPFELDEWTLFSMRSDTQLSFSFDNGPELEIKAVTEQSTEPLTNYPSLYNNLTMLGFNIYSGQGVQDLRSLSVFVNKGKLVRRLNDDGTYSATPDTPTSLAPEVFLDTILDTVDGIGQYAKVGGIDLTALAKAKRFCQQNRLYFDGVIADPTSWRQFWAEVAPYSLLELGRIGGKETLIPAVPCDNAGNITRTVPISALFNAGNILEGTYKEEFIDYGSSVQDLIATVIYRNTERDGVFPRNASVDVSLRDASEASAIRQTFDLSQYVTNRSQAILYAKLLCQQRRNIRRSVEFRTFPTDSPLSPGSYIYVDIGHQDWQGIYSGQIQSGGALNVPLAESIPDGSYSVLLYRSGQAVVTTTASISANTAAGLASYEGWLFVLGTAVRSKRVFRIVEVQMDEEGEVTVRAVEHPCDSSGQSLIADFSDGLFTIR